MTATHKPISFLATAKPSQAKVFYGGVLGLPLIDKSPYALVFDDNGVMLRVQIVRELTPAPYTVHGWQVAGIEVQIAALVSKGVVFLHFDQLTQSISAVWTSPEGHKIAWFKDPDGNILSLTQIAVQ